MTGRFPKQCKTAHITPVYKKGDKLDTSNYKLQTSFTPS